MDFNEFNNWKNKAFQTKTEEEYRQWQADFREWYDGHEFNEWEKNLIKEQITKLNEQKEAYFSKRKQQPQIIRNSYIFQDSLAEALTEYIRVKTELMKKELSSVNQ